MKKNNYLSKRKELQTFLLLFAITILCSITACKKDKIDPMDEEGSVPEIDVVIDFEWYTTGCNEVSFDIYIALDSSFTLDLGDGTIYTDGEYNLKHDYAKSGIYTVTLRVIDITGELHTKTKTIDLGTTFDHPINGTTGVFIYGEHKVIQTSDGGSIYIFAEESSDQYNVVTKLDKNGNELWRKSNWAICEGYCFFTAVREDTDGNLILGGWGYANYNTPDVYTYSVFLKTDANGNEIWTRNLGDTNAQVKLNDIIPTSDGGYLLSAKYFFSNTTYIYKTNANGAFQWDKEIGDSNQQGLRTLLERDNKFYAVSKVENLDNTYSLKLNCFDLNGNLQWENTYILHGFYSLAQDRDWLRLFGRRESTISGNDEARILTIDPENGNLLNQSNHGERTINGMATDALLNQVITGTLPQGHAYITKIDPFGTELWTRTIFEGTQQLPAFGYDASATEEGGYIVFTQDNNSNMHIIKIDCAGNIE